MWLVLVFFVLGVPAAVVLGVMRAKSNKCTWNGKELAVGVPGVIFTVLMVICGIIFAISYFYSISAYSKMYAYKQVVPYYELAVARTATVAVVKLPDAEIPPEVRSVLVELGISVENLKQSSNISDRIVELRDLRKEYYDRLNWYKMCTSKWITRQFIAKMPRDLLE